MTVPVSGTAIPLIVPAFGQAAPLRAYDQHRFPRFTPGNASAVVADLSDINFEGQAR